VGISFGTFSLVILSGCTEIQLLFCYSKGIFIIIWLQVFAEDRLRLNSARKKAFSCTVFGLDKFLTLDNENKLSLF